MDSAAECENFCSTLELMHHERPESLVGNNLEPCSLFVFTWNMGNKAPDNQDLRAALPCTGYDLIVLGVQECDYPPRGTSRNCENDWFRLVEGHLEANYVKVEGTSLWSIRLLIFVSKAKVRHGPCPAPSYPLGGANPAAPAARNLGSYCGTGESNLLCLRLTHGQVDICIWGSFGSQSCILVSSFLLLSLKMEEIDAVLIALKLITLTLRRLQCTCAPLAPCPTMSLRVGRGCPPPPSFGANFLLPQHLLSTPKAPTGL